VTAFFPPPPACRLEHKTVLIYKMADSMEMTYINELTDKQRQALAEAARHAELMMSRPMKSVNGETWYQFKKFKVTWRVLLERRESGRCYIIRDD